MRVWVISLALIATCGSLAAPADPSNSTAVRAHGATEGSRVRTWLLTLSPAPGELALAQISFRHAGRRALSTRSLRVSVGGPFGDDYLAAAAARSRAPAGPRVLVVLVNRPSALLDPVQVRLRLTALRSLGPPLERIVSDPFARPAGSTGAAICDLAARGALSASTLRPLGSRGSPLAGFDAAAAVAQAYDAVCGLPYAAAFQRAITPAPAPPVLPQPQPQPQPPAPGCTPCDPPPGYACPLVEPGICVAPLSGAGRRALAGPH